MDFYFTTDTHFSHRNLVKGISTWEGLDRCRPYGTIEDHDDTIIDNINSFVKPGDFLFHLGDFGFGDVSLLRSRIKCKNIHLIYGNHDKEIRKKKSLQSLFLTCSDLKRIKIDNQDIILCHYPLLSWEKMHHGSWMLSGHSHGSLDLTSYGKILDVCLEKHDYFPWSFAQVKEFMDTKSFVPIDHHRIENEIS